MKNQKTGPGFSVIPKGEKTCIWMDAGLVNFKLCDRDFKCDTCPFNMAMEACYGKNPGPVRKPAVLQEAFESAVPSGLWKFRLDTALYLSACHTWIRPMGVRDVRVGLDDFIISLLGGVDRVSLPSVGQKVKAGGAMAEVFQGKRAFTVISPVEGVVTDVNERLLELPGLMVQEPTTGGYLCQLEVEDMGRAMRVCKTGKQLLRWYYHEIEWVEMRISEVLDSNRAALGELAYDGGMMAPISEILPDDVFRQVISGLLGSPE